MLNNVYFIRADRQTNEIQNYNKTITFNHFTEGELSQLKIYGYLGYGNAINTYNIYYIDIDINIDKVSINANTKEMYQILKKQIISNLREEKLNLLLEDE